MVKTSDLDLEGCRIEISTEQAIGRKRDDLRIEGWMRNADGESRLFLWSVEIKVYAGFHYSSAEDSEPDDDSEVTELKHQLLTYHEWLSGQKAQIKGGFVLGIDDMRSQLPDELKNSWQCVTWTTVGILLRETLQNEVLTDQERFLCRHVLGFIAEHLWRSAEMPEAKLDFDDFSFFRAWVLMAEDCERKIAKLIDPLAEIVEKWGIGDQTCRSTNLFKNYGLYAIGKRLIAGDKVLTLWAGVSMDKTGDEKGDGASMLVGIDSGSQHKYKERIRALCPKLQELDSEWDCNTEVGAWFPWDVWLAKPLVQLLNQPDQEATMQNFVETALANLTVAGIQNAIK